MRHQLGEHYRGGKLFEVGAESLEIVRLHSQIRLKPNDDVSIVKVELLLMSPLNASTPSVSAVD